jgi:hypothetical protein
MTVINVRWFHDNYTLKVHKGETGTSKIWDLTVDKKNEFTENICQCIQAQKARGYHVLIMRQDNAEENKKLEKRLQSTDLKLQVKIE